jgi:hypothetical protein
MEKRVLFLAAVVLSAAGLAAAQEGELHGYIDVTYQTKYVWRGFDIFADKSAIQPSVNLDLYGTGFGVNVMAHRANSSDHENGERWDYMLYYCNKIYEGEQYATNYRLAGIYYNYPDQPTEGTSSAPNASLYEAHALLSWPAICPAGFVPSYVLVKLWPVDSGSFSGARSPFPGAGTASGWAHIFMLDYPMSIPGILPETPEQTLNWHSELVFNDGVGPAGQNVDHDWTNFTFGASTDFDLGNDFTMTPGLWYQVTMDKSANSDQDETWATLGVKYTF